MLDLRLQGKRLFGIPVYSFRWPNHEDFNLRLRGLIDEKRKTDRGVKVSNVGGWHSSDIKGNWKNNPDLNVLDQMIKSMVGSAVKQMFNEPTRDEVMEWTIQKWANVSASGNRNAKHTHVNLMTEMDFEPIWSGVYYVTGGSPIRFHDYGHMPARADDYALSDRSLSFTLTPNPGDMILFPATAEHSVDAVSLDDDRNRISIAFNLGNPAFNLPFLSENTALGKQIIDMRQEIKTLKEKLSQEKPNAKRKAAKKTPTRSRAAKKTTRKRSSNKS